MDTTELQNQAIEIRDAENEGENTALRVGTMLLAIIDAFANIVDLDTLQQILEQYASTTGNGQIHWRHARCVFLASMGADFDAVNGDGWEYTDHNGDIVFNPTSKSLRVVGETGSYFVYTNVLYVHAHTSHAYKWDAAEQKMVEVTDSNLPAVITYKNTPAFSQVAIGESYVFQSQSSGPKIAIKISSSETYSFLPDPKKIYAFRDIRQAMLWKPSNQTWVSLTPRVINDLTTGGEGDALSAEMGKKLRTAIDTILNNLGNYAFPGGKPTIDWGGDVPVPSYSVSKTIGTGLSASGGDTSVDYGDSLEVTISITNNLYVIDDDNVEVIMGGSPLAGAWNASTKKVHIAAVTGDVVINVPSMTYVSSGLAFHLDCKNRGGQAGHWIDRIGNIDFTLGSGVTSADSGVVFDGTVNAYGMASGSLNKLASAGATIEVVATANRLPAPLLINPEIEGISARLYSDGNSTQFVFMMGTSGTPTTGSFVYNGDDVGVSANKERVLIRGDVYSGAVSTVTTGGPTSSQFTIGARLRTNGSTNEYLSGKIMAIRVYSSSLSESDQKKNYAIDKKRFNLS